MKTYTVYCKLLAKEDDILDYKTLVFKNLENSPPFGHQYIMITVWPNWQSRIPDIDEVGFLTYDFIEAGIDTYYDRNLDSFIKYNFTNLAFKKFVKKQDNSNKNIIL